MKQELENHPLLASVWSSSAHLFRVAKMALPIVLLAAATGAEAQLANSAWPCFQGNAAGTGQGPGAGATPTVKWQPYGDQFEFAAPAIGPDGTIYTVDTGGTVLAYDPTTGSIKWAYYDLDYAGYSGPAVGTDGTVYVSNYLNLYALNGSDGSLKWIVPYTGGGSYSSPTIGPNGTVYALTDGAGLFAINPADGSLIWNTTTDIQGYDQSPVIGPDGTIYVAGNEFVQSINPNTGAANWTFSDPNEYIIYATVGPDGTVYVRNYFGYLAALDGASGAVKWSTTVPNSVESYTGLALSSNGTLYSAGYYGVDAFNASSGALLWSTSIYGLEDFYTYPAVGGDGTVYIAGYNGFVYALNGATGAIAWSQALQNTTDNNVYSSFAIGADGSLYLPSFGGGLVAFEGAGNTENISGLTPNSRAVNGGHFSVFVSGSGFTTSSVVNWAGTPLETIFVSANQIRAEVSNAFLTSPGNFAITVTDNGQTTNSLNFGVFEPNPVPTLTDLSTYTVTEGGPGFTLTLTGTNFLPRSNVKWGGRSLVTTYVSPTQLSAWVPADFYDHRKTVQVDVTNPKPGGGASNTLSVSVD